MLFLRSVVQQIDAGRHTEPDNRLFVATGNGTISIYPLSRGDPAADDQVAPLKAGPAEIKKGLTKRGIDQMGIMEELSILVVLSGVSLDFSNRRKGADIRLKTPSSPYFLFPPSRS